MAWDISVPFDEAVSWFLTRLPIKKSEFEQLDAAAKKRAFTVANVAQMDIIADTQASLASAMELGTTLKEWSKEFGPTLETAWRGTVADPPFRLECLTGDNLVTGAVVRAAHRRWYEGDVIEVVTASGRKFTTTPNHPMLTRHGWVGTGKLREGDDLIGYRRQQYAGAGRDHDKAQPPPTIAQVFDALALNGQRERVEGVPLDFHGDGAERDVDIVRPVRDLVLGRFAALRKPVEQFVFAVTDLAGARFCPACSHLVVVTERCGFCDRPTVHSGATQPVVHHRVADVETLRDRVGALASRVTLRDLRDGDVSSLGRSSAALSEIAEARRAEGARDPGALDDAADPSGRHRNERSDARDALPGEIEFDRVVSLDARSFSGHVFNLSTQHGYYCLSGLYTGNTIYRNNVQSSYSAGRERLASHPTVRKLRPYKRFDAVMDRRTTDDICRPLNGVVKPADDPWWETHTPPLHHRCRSGTVTLTDEQAEEEGITTETPDAKAQHGWGARVSAVDAAWEPEQGERDDDLWAEFQRKNAEEDT